MAPLEFVNHVCFPSNRSILYLKPMFTTKTFLEQFVLYLWIKYCRKSLQRKPKRCKLRVFFFFFTLALNKRGDDMFSMWCCRAAVVHTEKMSIWDEYMYAARSPTNVFIMFLECLKKEGNYWVMCLVKCFLALSAFNRDGRGLFCTWGNVSRRYCFLIDWVPYIESIY